MTQSAQQLAISVRVPATSANLGPGFDCLGMALDLHNTFKLFMHQPFAIEVAGESAERLPKTTDNVIVKAMHRVFRNVGIEPSQMPSFALHVENQIPVSSGLGSSASAIVGGVVLGNSMVQLVRPELALHRDKLLAIATEIEGHPDNVAPALLGGGVLAFYDRAGLRTTPIPIPQDIRFVAATPNFALSTDMARRVLPTHYKRSDVVENVAQCARLMLALTKPDLDLLRGGLIDHLHEPYRRPLVPGADEVVTAAMEAGAYAVTLSGAGPTLLAWCRPDHAVTIADEMTLAWLTAGTPCRALVLRPTLRETVPDFEVN